MVRRVRFLSLALFLAFSFAAISACSSAAPSDPAAKKDAGGGANAVALIDGQPITQAQLDEKAAASLMQARQQEFEARSRALDVMIGDQLVEKEAKAQGTTPSDLIQKQVTGKVAEPTQAEIDQVWEANKNRVGGKTKEQVQPDIVNYLKNQKASEFQKDYIKGLRAKYKVQILLDPPRIPVQVDDDPAKGPVGARVTIVEFSDFQCPFCGRVEGAVKQILTNYKDKVHFVYRDFPLVIHPFAPKAAEAAQCANEQGKFWEYHDALYADQTKLAVTDLQATAVRLGLKADQFKSCLESGKFAAEVSKDSADAQKAGVSSTPSFFINGIPLVGAQDYQTFADVIDRELARPAK